MRVVLVVLVVRVVRVVRAVLVLAQFERLAVERCFAVGNCLTSFHRWLFFVSTRTGVIVPLGRRAWCHCHWWHGGLQKRIVGSGN